MTQEQFDQTIWQQQVALEEEMKDTGISSYRSTVSKARNSSSESTTLYGITLMKHSIDAVVKKLNEFLEEAFSGRAGRIQTAAPFIAELDPEKAAFLSLKFIIDGVSSKYTMTKVAMAIGGALEDEAKFAAFEQQEKGWFSKVRNEVTKRTSNRHYRRYALIHTMTKKAMIDFEAWSKQERLHVGMKMIDLIIQATGLVRCVTHVFGRKQRQIYIEATPKTLEWIEKVNTNGALLSPHYMPCLLPPRNWTTPFDGGYHTEHIRPLPLIKSFNKKYLLEMEDHAMPMEYDATNALQRTAWAVNPFVMTVMETAWESGESWAGLPARYDQSLPPSPFPGKDKKDMTPDELERFVQWKHQASRVHQANAKSNSKRLQFVRTLQMAKRFCAYPEFYYPYQMDFRGRKYAVPSFLNPQGTSYAKALLTFANGEPIENEEQAGWLAIHGANRWGYDKAALLDRVLWAYTHTDEIRACAQAPFDNRWWTKADDPWGFLAFCKEWDEFMEQGYGYLSRLPIALDGTNNGLQHFAAQMRCEVGGRATNLIPMDKPQDIYQEVANKVIEWLKVERDKGDEMARQWLEFGITRKTCKRPVMVVPYGGQRFSCRGYIEDYIIEQQEAGKEHPWGTDLFKPSQYLTNFVWDAIGEVVVSARQAMGYIQEVASLVSKENLPLIWQTPSGFVVQQQYPETETRRISTYIDNTLLKPALNEQDWSRVDKRRAVQGSSPNFVHSMDAAAMTITICKALNHGIKDFAMIHDSYGVHARHTPTMTKLIREAFVEMYEKNDVLAQFRESAMQVLTEAPEVPRKGVLEIQQVLDSDFFFS